MLTVAVTHYIFIWKQICDCKRMGFRQCKALVTCQAIKNMGGFIVLQRPTAQKNTYQNNYTSDQPQMVKLLDTF